MAPGAAGALGALARAGVAAAEPVGAAPVEGVVREAQLEAPAGRAGLAVPEVQAVPGVTAPVGVVAPGARAARREELAPVDPVAVVGPVAVATPVEPGAAEAAVAPGAVGALGVLARAGVAAAEPVGAAPVEGVVREAQLEAPGARAARREELAPVDPVAVVGLAAQGSRTAPRAPAGLPSTTVELAASIIGIPATRGM